MSSSINHGMLDDSHWQQFSSDFSDYELDSPIGFGAYSIVYSAVYRAPPLLSQGETSNSSTTASEGIAIKPTLSLTIPTHHDGSFESSDQACAVKVSTSHPDVDQLFKETRLLSLCRHPNVLRILAAFTLPPDHHRVAIVTPLVPGGSLSGILQWRSRLPVEHSKSLFQRSRKGNLEEDEPGRLSEEEIKAVVKQVLDGLVYLHSSGFIHRDLKAGNLLVDTDGTILLADFGVGGDVNQKIATLDATRRAGIDNVTFKKPMTGMSISGGKRFPDRTPTEEYGRRRSFVGTPNWMAPEIISGQKYDYKADIWSLGITIIELATGSAPRSRDNANSILLHIVNDEPPSLNHVQHLSKAMKDFVALCLNKDPLSRPSANDLLDHPWVKNAKKKSFLAETLLRNLPTLDQRQEIHRVPTESSIYSVVSTWDFSPSVTNSPIRTSLLPLRSPSVVSHRDLFPHHATRGHSRDSSFSAIPPSPRVSLRHWAERTASLDVLGLGGTEDGHNKNRRPRSQLLRQYSASQVTQVPRRQQSANFDDRSGVDMDSVSMIGDSPVLRMRGRQGRLPAIARDQMPRSLSTSPETSFKNIQLVASPQSEESASLHRPADSRIEIETDTEHDHDHEQVGVEHSAIDDAGCSSSGTSAPSEYSIRTPPPPIPSTLQALQNNEHVTRCSSEGEMTPVQEELSASIISSSSSPTRQICDRDRDRDRSGKEVDTIAAKKGWLGRRLSMKKDRTTLEKEKEGHGWRNGFVESLRGRIHHKR